VSVSVLGIAPGLRDVTRGDISGGLRSVAMGSGFSFAAVGFVAGRVAGVVQGDRRARAGPAPRNGHMERREEDAHGANSR
jgi:hypothetical protein